MRRPQTLLLLYLGVFCCVDLGRPPSRAMASPNIVFILADDMGYGDLDTEVGRLLETLEKLELVDDTVVVIASDNGGVQNAAELGPLRGSKGTTWEGGIRVPLIIRWPGRIRSHTVSNQVCVSLDLTTSFLTLAGCDLSAEQLDGYDIIEHVAAERREIPRTLFWRGKRGQRTWCAVRDGDLKYVRKAAHCGGLAVSIELDVQSPIIGYDGG